MIRLSDIVGRLSSSQLLLSIALLLFFLVFVGVLWYAYRFLSQEAVEHFSALPLQQDERPTATLAAQVNTQAAPLSTSEDTNP